MADYENTNPLYEYRESIQTVLIEDGATNIGDYAFYYCTHLTNVTIPNSVTKINSGTFFGCSGLANVTIPDSVTSIGSYAFSNCTNLKKLVIPETVETIAANAFTNCSSIKTAGPIGGDYGFEYGWTDTIPTYPFNNFTRLESVVFPDSITTIDVNAFLAAAVLSLLFTKGLWKNGMVLRSIPGTLR